MKAEDYQKYIEKFLANYEIRNVSIHPGLVRVDMIPHKDSGWQTCTFIFTENHIVCFGDIESFVWRTTWNAAEGIKHGHCNAGDFSYLAEKLEHAHELKTWECTDEVMEEIKEYLIYSYYCFDDDERKEFEKKWEKNYYLIGDVDKYRISGLDEFFQELDVDDYYEYYHWFEDYPDHYYMATAMLRCIEDYFSKEQSHENEKD